MTTRQEVCDALKAQLQTITVTNGYSTDLGTNVIAWSDVLIEPKTDTLIFGDTSEKYSEENQRLKRELTIEIQATVFTADYATVSRQVLEEMISALYKKRSLGLKRCFIEVTESSTDVDDGGRDIVFIYLKTEITYYKDILI